MGTLVNFSTMFSLLILAASVGFPKFVVPNLPDVTVKSRRYLVTGPRKSARFT